MLERLDIKNFALIENLHIDFTSGFNVISGETGAGKSIILGALNLLLGQKADGQVVRSGCDETTVAATFSFDESCAVEAWLREHDLDSSEGMLLIRRIVRPNGRGMIYIQGQPMTRPDLEALNTLLIDMSGQHDHQSLMSRERQRMLLDTYGGNAALVASFVAAYANHAQLMRQRQELAKRLAEGAREVDYLRFSLEEIEKVDPKAGEDDSLRDEIQVVSSYEHIHENLEMVQESLRSQSNSEGVISSLHAASIAMQRCAKADPSLAEYTSRLESLRIESVDIHESIRDYLGGMSYSQERLDQMQDRLSRIQKLKKKYGPSLDDVLAYAARAQESLHVGEVGEDALLELDAKLEKAQQAMMAEAQKLTTKRRECAARLSKQVVEKLRHLGMANAQFVISITSVPVGPSGADGVDFLIAANPGEAQLPIRDVASGGELSRIMLSIKTVLGESDDIATMVFDEVDAGIGGTVANAVGEQLQQLAASRQVIAITHLAAIAARAASQFVVAKHIQDGRTFTMISPVCGDERVREIARMLSGDSDSEASLSHARQLLGN